jgi:hypothetical protein
LVDERGIFFYQFFVFSAFPPLPGYFIQIYPVSEGYLRKNTGFEDSQMFLAALKGEERQISALFQKFHKISNF